MIKEMNGWKVIRQGRLSAIRSTGRPIYYHINEIVLPTIPYSKIFFFKNEEDAEKFVDINFYHDYDYYIVPCVAYNCTQQKYMASPYSEYEDIKLFWERKHKKKKTIGNVRQPPKGTWFAEKIMCLE